ncbi:MAG TPA: hypothetical protein VHF22_09725 [Planctomycetota bacterium]|nr:hypothetical protein [Planctomycetota bacterium]
MTLFKSLAAFTFALVVAAAPALAQSAARAPAPATYFPLPVSARWYKWDYSVAPNGPVKIATRKITIEADRIITTNPRIARAKLTGYLEPGAVAFVERAAAGQVTEYTSPRGPIFPWYDFAAAPGVPFPCGLERNRFPGVAVTAESDGVAVCAITPAGVFEDCRRFVYTTPGVADAGITTETFAPGIGLVARSEATMWGSFETRLLDVRTSLGWSLVGRRPLDASLTVTPDQVAVGGAAPRPGMPPRRYQITATLHLAAQARTRVTEPRLPATFYMVSDGGQLIAKLEAARAGIRSVDARGVDYAVTFDTTSLPIGTVTIAAETNLVPGAPVATATVEVLAAP